MTWTLFWDMHSGGGLKEPQAHIYIEAPEDEARVIFYNRFGHNPGRVTCTCCGEDYSVSSSATLARLSGHHRNCATLETPRDPKTRRYVQPDDPWFQAHYYLEPDEEDEARARGWTVRENTSRRIGREHGSDFGKYMTVEEYVAGVDVLVVSASDIKDSERVGDVPDEGYVWVG